MPNEADDFNEQREQGEQAPAHIWLRYATQFTAGERTYTIDIGIPVPPGADAATREQLLREADAGLDQLADYVERRVMQVAQQSGQGQRPSAVPRPTAPAIPTPPPVAAPAPLSLPASPAAVQAQPTTTGAAPASPAGRPSTPAREAPSRPSVSPSPTARATPPVQSAQATRSSQSSQPAAPVAPGRPGIGASMPSSPGLNEGTMSLPEFLKYLKDMGLDARRAMALLKVKSLSDLNLREALKQLQHILMEEDATSSPPTPANRQQAQAQAPARSSTGPQAPTRSQSAPARSTSGTGEGHSAPGARAAENTVDTARATTGSAPSPQATQAAQTRQTNQTAAAPAATANRPARPATPASPAPSAPSAPSPLSSASSPASTARPASDPAASAASGAKNLREGQASYPIPIVFDEEDDESEQDLDFDEDEDEDEEQEESFGAGVGLSAAHRGSVEDIVSRLRESGGTTPVSASRLKVLHNVVDGQLKPEQLQALVRGVWGAASEKKLKSDQAEALISWGKQDDFVAEAEMLLAHFEENGDASSNR